MNLQTICLIGVAAGLACASLGCTRADLVEPDARLFDDASDALGIEMIDAAFWVNGTLRSSRVNLESDSFEFLFVYLQHSGLFIVTLEPNDATIEAGRFVNRQLAFETGGVRVVLESQGGHIFSDAIDRVAHVEFIPGLNIAQAGIDIVGLAQFRSHIPGL